MNRKDDKFTPLFFTQTLFLGIFFAIPLFSFAQNGPISKIQNVQINQNTISGEILFLNDVSTTAFDNVFLTILLSEKTQEYPHGGVSFRGASRYYFWGYRYCHFPGHKFNW